MNQIVSARQSDREQEQDRPDRHRIDFAEWKRFEQMNRKNRNVGMR